MRYAECGNVSEAAGHAGIHRATHYRWLTEDEVYAAAASEAKEQAMDMLEAEVHRRAVEGVEEPVFYQGKICGYVRKYSDTLLIFLLKAARPDKYRERREIRGTGGGPLLVVTGPREAAKAERESP